MYVFLIPKILSITIDKIAIMLNAQLSDEDKMYYNKMQEWREFSGYIAKSINEKG